MAAARIRTSGALGPVTGGAAEAGSGSAAQRERRPVPGGTPYDRMLYVLSRAAARLLLR